MPRRRRSQPSPSARARLVREAVPFALLACACGAALRDGSRPALRDDAGAPESAPASEGDASTDPAFRDLAAHAQSLVVGMREIARKESSGERLELARAQGRDVCVRAAFRAAVPVVGKLVDGSGAILATSPAPTLEGVLGEHGPVCVRRGEVVSGLLEGPPAARVRWVVWEAP
jgi:hypothetical protein